MLYIVLVERPDVQVTNNDGDIEELWLILIEEIPYPEPEELRYTCKP